MEFLITVSIGMIVSVVAVPSVVVGVANIRLRSSMTSLAGVIQNCRMLAVKQNRAMITHFSTQPHGIMAYVKRASDPAQLATSDSQVQLEAPVSQSTSPSGIGAPAELDSTTLGFTPQTGDPSFNPTGLPCAYLSGNCPNSGFIYYFHDTRSMGQSGWAALSISPAGRLKKWFWDGSNWTD